jgi:integrase
LAELCNLGHLQGEQMSTRITIAPGIRRDQFGQLVEVRVKVRGVVRYMPAAVLRHADLAGAQRWQQDERKKLKVEPLDARPRREARGGLEDDLVGLFLPQIAGRVSFKADRSHARAWLCETGRDGKTPLGQLHRSAIDHQDLNIITARWQTAPTARAVRRIRVTAYARDRQDRPRAEAIRMHERKTPATSGQVVAARTIIHRLRVLDELYHTLDGAAAYSPCTEAKWPTKPKTIPPTVTTRTIIGVARTLAAEADPQTYARYLVLNTTAQRPCQVMRAEPDDVNLKARIWTVRNAKGAPGHTITLTEDAVRAWRRFIAADAWGWYDTTKHARAVHAAGWPVGTRPYAARHSMIQAALAAGVGLDEAQGLAGHASPVTTRQFYGPLAIPAQRAIAEKIDDRLAEVFRPRLTKRGSARKATTTRSSEAASAKGKLRAVQAAKRRRTPPAVLTTRSTTHAAGKGRK